MDAIGCRSLSRLLRIDKTPAAKKSGNYRKWKTCTFFSWTLTSYWNKMLPKRNVKYSLEAQKMRLVQFVTIVNGMHLSATNRVPWEMYISTEVMLTNRPLTVPSTPSSKGLWTGIQTAWRQVIHDWWQLSLQHVWVLQTKDKLMCIDLQRNSYFIVQQFLQIGQSYDITLL